MHPAFSVIFFTTFSGMGYGLLGLVGISALFDLFTNDVKFGISSIFIALILISIGLISSTFHLGHPERAWRAISQWRSSWLSREGLLALIAYIPALFFTSVWFFQNESSSLYSVLGILTSLFCIATVYTTSMIYASLKPISAWCNQWVPLVYLSLALMSGGVLFITLLIWFGQYGPGFAVTAMSTVIFAYCIKHKYWSYIDSDPMNSSIESATGLEQWGKVRVLHHPHTEDNYLQKEMGFVVARKHTKKLRKISLALSFFLPFILIAISLIDVYVLRLLVLTLSFISMLVGIFIERWLFFAEAKHTTMLYY